MSDYKEKFEKMRVAGKLAAQTLDMLTDNIKKVYQQIILIN
jgi:methionyl aminopeptidase